MAACEEVGWNIQTANMIRDRDDGSRLILVGAIPAGWKHHTPMLSLMTQVSARGDWVGTVDVRCVAADEEPPPGWVPSLQGQGAALLGERIEQLRETLAERQQVLAAIRTGRHGPFEFARMVWKVADLFAGWNPSGPS